MVTYPVTFTNRSNSAFVTGVRSIQNPSTETWCTGSASSMPHPSHPIQNVPPGIHTIFAGTVAGEDQQPAMAIETTTTTIEMVGRRLSISATGQGADGVADHVKDHLWSRDTGHV